MMKTLFVTILYSILLTEMVSGQVARCIDTMVTILYSILLTWGTPVLFPHSLMRSVTILYSILLTMTKNILSDIKRLLPYYIVFF